MSWLELKLLVDWLPQDSRTKAALAGDTADRRWSEDRWMQATQISLLQALFRLLWITGHMQGDPPEMKPPNVPELVDEAAEEQEIAVKRQGLEYLQRLKPQANK